MLASSSGGLYPPTMTSTAGGLVPTPPNDGTKFLNGQGAFAVPTGAGVTDAASVTYTPAGAGAIPTTVKADLDYMPKLTNWLPSGYVTDGSVDYTTQIQACLTANAGKPIFVPPFAYQLSSQRTIPAGTSLYCPAVQMDPNVNASPLVSGARFVTNSALFNFFKMSARTSLDGISFDSGTNTPTITGGLVIEIADVAGVILNNININRAFRAISVVNAAGYYNGVFVNNLAIKNYKDHGIFLSNAVGFFVNKFYLINNSIYTSGNTAIGLYEGTATADFCQGTLYGGGAGVVGSTSTPTTPPYCGQDWHFAAVDIDSFVGHGVNLSDAVDVTFDSGCWIGSNGGAGVNLTGGGDGYMFSDSTICQNYLSGGIINTTSGGVSFENNNIYSNNNQNIAGAGGLLFKAGQKDFSVVNNRIHNSTFAYPGGGAIYVGHQRYAVIVETGASDRYIISKNLKTTANATGAIFDGGTGANKDVSNNY